MVSTHAKVNDYITRSFRDVADEDYVAARALYRDGLDRQFLWAALQSVEKYLKAILAYNRISIKGLGHKISLALEKVRSISNSPFKIPQSVENFIKKLEQQGVDRYFEQPVNTDGLGLLELDLTVYHLRKYCRAVRPDAGTPAPSIDGRLEEILSKPSRARDDLVWKNLFFGRRKKKSIRFGRRTKWANPSTFISPEIFPELDRIIHFSKPVRCHFLRLLERNKNPGSDNAKGKR